MKRSSLRRTGGIATAAVALSITLAACGNEADDTASESTSSSAAPSESASESPSESASESASSDAGADVFGPGCSAVPADGAGSFNGMVTDPVATAASNNPLLGTLVTAVTQADLVDTLNGLEAATVFAPTDDAFAALPEATLNQVLGDQALLTAVLTHHVLPENLDPTAVVGEQTTVNSDTVTVEGDAEAGMTVSDSAVTANVLCGNIPTSNATVYVIDQVLAGATPPA